MGERDGAKKEELKMIYWANDEKAKVQEKMIYSGTKDEVVKQLKTGKEIQANDASDLNYNDIVMDLSRGKAITKYNLDEFAISSNTSSGTMIGVVMLCMLFAVLGAVLLGRRRIRSYYQRS